MFSFIKTFVFVLLIQLGILAQAADLNITVNGKPIKKNLYDFIVKDLASRGQKTDDNLNNMIVDRMIAMELINQEAEKTGLSKDVNYVLKEELARKEMLYNTFLQNYVQKNPISESDIKNAYEQYKKDLGSQEFNAKHILLANEQEAKDVIAELNKGGNFNKIAKDKSKDTGSKDKGGDLGWFPANSMVKPFAEALTSLKKGNVTTIPVQTQFGWHVIKLEDTRALQAPEFDKVKEGLAKTLQQKQLDKLVLDLKTKAKILDSRK
ncbi:SurA Parvulin-like peptidyl-prolyl isomerase [Methylophilaceae bacterium]